MTIQAAAPDALGAFLDPVALAIVIGGTLLAMLLRSPWRDVGRAFAALATLGRSPFDATPLLDQLAALTRIARRHGVHALDRSKVADPDVAAAVALAADRGAPDAVQALVEQCRAARVERHRAAIEVWSGAAEAAPAMGMVGTLIGLVRMFMAMSDPAAIGGAMAVALLATLYGALLANLVALPIAARLRRLARAEAQQRARLEAPLVALARIEPVRLQEQAA